ncbi:T9SS type B sorting domain-containing protein [Tenacibaculum ovolyticum]|uniref:T9SS type B sorting domain-containing protein n=1 Tax=Tenacibaculum ovolyticum TaxID=104270 RepID=UPI003BABBA92
MFFKKFSLFLFFSLILITPLAAQQNDPATCISLKRPEAPTLQEFNQQRKSLSKNNVALRAAGTTAIVQSVHNTIAKWESGSYYRYDIGTTPGDNNINRGSLLGVNAKNTRGHSYEELRRSAIIEGTPNFNLGDTFYINLYNFSGDTNPWVSQPMSFNVETLGAAANEVTINIEMGYGVNGLGPFATWQRDKMQAFYSRVNPIIKEVYGAPSRNHIVNIVNDGLAVGTNTYYNGPNQISTTYSENNGDLSQPRLMIHELLHGYRDNVVISSDDEWHYTPVLSGFEEGMAEAVALIVMDIFIERYPNFFNADEFKVHWGHSRGMPFDWDYDFQNHEQLTTTDFFSSDIGTGAHWERYGAAQTAMQKIYIEDKDVFKKFNAEYYRRLTADYTLLPTRNLVINIFETILPEVERTPITDWINKQRVLDCKVVPGKKVHLLTFQKADQGRIQTTDNRLHIYDTQNNVNGSEWSWNIIKPRIDANNDPSERWYVQSNNINGQLQIYNYDGTLHQPPIAIKNDKAARKQGVPAYLGPYQGSNIYEYNGTFTANDGKGIGPQPGGGKRPVGIENHNFTATNTPNRAHGDLFNANNQPDPATQLISGLEDFGLYRYDITFEGGNYAGTYYRLHGTDLVGKDGLIGGIKSEDDTNQIKGKLIIEHENFGEEPEIIIDNGAFIKDRLWTSVPATSQRQGGRTDRRYSEKGKVHAIYISEDCTQQKIDFRNITYGDGLAGSQLFLFTVENFQDIEYKTLPEITVCKDDDFTLNVTNNFEDILDGDTRISYQWVNPMGTEIATTKSHVFTNAQKADEGIYTLKIDFFGCEIIKTTNIIVTDDTFTVTTPTTLELCESTTLNIAANDIPGATYAWTGPNLFTATTKDIEILNTPLAATGDYIVSATIVNCSGINETLTSTTTVTVNSTVTPTFTFTTTYCLGATADMLPTTSDNGITGTWNTTTIDTNITGATNYIFTPDNANQCGETVTIPVTINTNSNITPTFTFTTTYCEGATANVLPTISDNGITGTWNTTTVDTNITGATNYIFTPNNPNQCGEIVTIPITVNATVIPVFSFSTTYCEGATANTLPTTSDNGITGTWNTTTIDTNIIGATNYIFTPNTPTQCGEAVTISVTINATITPTFSFLTTYCEGATANPLPTTSDNGITGTWNTTTIDTNIIGATNYIFTPNDANQCGEATTIPVTINATVTPVFSFSTTYCEGATTTALPTTSDNGITGAWNIATIDTSITGATNYVFTPNDAYQCGALTTISVTVNTTVTPIFSFLTTYCESATPNALPTTSDNGITGTWNIATIDTSITGATNYVFTPNDANQCGALTTISVTVNTTVTPIFSFLTTYCEGATINALPTTSDNGITGTWNTTSIDTNITGATNYIFTPSNPNQCGEIVTIPVTINATITPIFSFLTTYCEGASANALPTTSDNGITGIWNTATIDTNITGTTNYVFTPNNTNQCGALATISVTINATITPVFSFSTTYCEGATVSTLPTTSDNGITGTWNTTTIDTNIIGTTNYTFTPSLVNQCGEVLIISVKTNQNSFTLAPITPITICETQTLNISAESISGATYSWTGPNGFTAITKDIQIPNITTNASGNYTVSVTKTNCLGIIETKKVIATVTVNENTFTINQNPTPIEICETESLFISIDLITGADYNWSGPNGFTANTREINIPNISITNAGNYTVSVSAMNCTGVLETKTSTTNVIVNESFKVASPATIITCFTEEITIDINDVVGATYSWVGPNGFTANTKDMLISNATLAMEGDYTISVTAPNCMGAMVTKTSTTKVTVNVCAKIPSYFTPNEDGKNDTWEIDSALIPFSFINIYDRYGKLINKLTPKNNNWNGYYNGQKMPSTDYWYLIEYVNQKQDTGNFSLLRK